MLSAKTLQDLDRELVERNLGGHWHLDIRSLPPRPKTKVRPHLWSWSDVYSALLDAGELVSLEMAERRTIRLINPGIKDRAATTDTLHMSVQLVKPGETATCHRHSMTALRFVVKGGGAYTTVEGQQARMAVGDLILTPSWTWHDHSNDGDEPIVWLDVLDLPLVQSLELLAFEPYQVDRQEITSTSESRGHLGGLVRPAGAAPGLSNPYFHYRWDAIQRSLDALVLAQPADPWDGYALSYVNPATGGPTLPTAQCGMTLLQPGQETRPRRRTSTAIYHAFRGSGTTFVGDQRFDWGPGDTFVVPVWHDYHHTNSTTNDAVLFSVSDKPVIEALGLYHEEKD
jgi:gentisate 1,2-dioxygenase